MNEITFKRLALWQTEAATITDSFERFHRATVLFSDLPNVVIWADGSVGVTDPTKSQTFGEFQPTTRRGLINCIYISGQ